MVPAESQVLPLWTAASQKHMLKLLCWFASAGENVAQMMEGWTYRAGFPLVSVEYFGPESDGILALSQVCRSAL